MVRTILKLVAPMLVVGGLMASAATAAPMSNTLALKNAVDSQVDSVRWRGGWGGRGFGWGGVAAGAIIGGALASRYYYGPSYGYGPYYGAPYGYGYPRPYHP